MDSRNIHIGKSKCHLDSAYASADVSETAV